MTDTSMDDSADDQADRRADGEDEDADDELLDERLVVVFSVAVFATPALLTALRPFVDFPGWVVRGSPLLIFVAVGIYGALTRSDDDERTDAPDDTRGGRRPELVGINYEMVSQQAIYRDQLLIRANYFSVAVVAVLVNIFLRTSPEFRPAVAMIGATTAYAFWLATESYKGTRDELNDELRRLESTHRDLSVVETYDTRERSRVGKRSLSSYFVGLQIATTVLWVVVYLGYTTYLTYL